MSDDLQCPRCHQPAIQSKDAEDSIFCPHCKTWCSKHRTETSRSLIITVVGEDGVALMESHGLCEHDVTQILVSALMQQGNVRALSVPMFDPETN